ncbi:MAG TPA: hypothetical protein PKA64_07000 [Myxococcota bacterium]|nr:hypothetical protein [Myxococcota bacterium]
MTPRALTALLVVQTLLLTLLVVDRLMPVAQAQSAMTCEISNWPALLTGQGYSNLRVQIEDVRSTIPVDVKSIDNTVPIAVRGWQTSDRVSVQP